jgi:N-acetylglucosamine repressor
VCPLLKSNFDQKATPTYLKKHNEALLLREIYAHQAVSRVQLAKLTKLSKPSVTELTQGLIEKGLIFEIGPEDVPDKVGKKPTLLALNADAYQMVCVVIHSTTIVVSLLDLRVQVIEVEKVPLNGSTGKDLVDLLVKAIRRMVDKATRPILGISVGSPGIIDSFNGVVHLTANFGWNDLPLAQILTEQFHVPVYIGNDSNFAAMGEYRFGIAQGVGDLLVVEVGEGIGIGILDDGRIIHGSTHAAGELGHTPFPFLDEVCICGQCGCLETLVSWWGLKRHAEQLVKHDGATILRQIVGDGPINSEAIRAAFEAGDPDIIALIDKAAVYLGRALVIVINLLNPYYVVLTGSLLTFGDLFIDTVRKTVHDHTLPYVTSRTQIVAEPLDDKSIMYGAGAFLLERELGL